MRFIAAAAVFGAAMAAPGMGEIEARDYSLTVTSTELSTIYSCGPEVTSCPYSTATPTPTVAPEYTTSIVYKTIEHTITSCAATVTDCPAHSTIVSTETVEDYTTICPVTATEEAIPTTSVYVAPIELSYITYTTCIPSTYVSTITVTPEPTYSAAPTYSANSSYIALPTTPPQFEGAGSSIKGSMFAAGLLAIAAVLFA